MSATGTVYAARVAGMVKIGFTAGAVEHRLAELQTANPCAVELVTTWPGDRALERRLHVLFADQHLRGEWFDMPPNWRELADREVARPTS